MSLFLDTLYPDIDFQKGESANLPHDSVSDQPRRGNKMLNKFADYHHFSTAAKSPNKEVAEHSEIKSTEAVVTSSSPYLKILERIDLMEKRTHEKIENLRQKGVQGEIEEKVQQTLKAPSQLEASYISFPGNQQAVTESVISSTELK